MRHGSKSIYAQEEVMEQDKIDEHIRKSTDANLEFMASHSWSETAKESCKQEIARRKKFKEDTESLRKQLNRPSSTLHIQHGGVHYKKLGSHQPWEVLKSWLTEEEFRGFMKGTAIAYLARERQKGKAMDIDKAIHTLQALRELTTGQEQDKSENTERGDTASS